MRHPFHQVQSGFGGLLLCFRKNVHFLLGKLEIEGKDGAECFSTMNKDKVPVDFLYPGMMVGGNYRVETFIRRGGSGEVWTVRHVKFEDRRFAVKVLRPGFGLDLRVVLGLLDDRTKCFYEEVQFCRAIRHRGIVEIVEWGRLSDDRSYMVMECLEGESLGDLMKREGAMPLHRVLGLVDGILDVLSAVHKAGVLHRNLKPPHIFIARQSDGTEYIKLLDFGQAIPVPAAPNSQDSQRGNVLMMSGTPPYIAPEQVKSFPSTPMTDIYALGVLIFKMLTGKLPFDSKSTIGMMRARLYVEPIDIRCYAKGIPDALAGLLNTMLKRLPEERPPSVDEVKQRLRWIFQ